MSGRNSLRIVLLPCKAGVCIERMESSMGEVWWLGRALVFTPGSIHASPIRMPCMCPHFLQTFQFPAGVDFDTCPERQRYWLTADTTATVQFVLSLSL